MRKSSSPNILVTGGAGYIGNCLLQVLSSNSKRTVVSIDTREKRKSRRGSTIFVRGNIRERELLHTIFKKYHIDVVIHLAGYINVAESMRKPDKYFDNNVVAGLRLLEAMKMSGVRKIIYASSAAVYGIPTTRRIKEEHQRRPINVYGMAKSVFEDLIRYYHDTHGFSCVIFRYFNVAGADVEHQGREDHRPETHFIPLALRSLLQHKPTTIYGGDYDTLDGTSIRDFVHVKDVVRAHTAALPLLVGEKICDTFNLGSGKGFSVLQTLNVCAKLVGSQPHTQWAGRREGDPALLVADCRKAKKVLGWQAKYKLEHIVQDALSGISQ